MTMYEGWRITRWETPVADMDRILMVSLTDAQRELVVVVEAYRATDRPRWRVRFRDYAAYRNIDEAYRLNLWRWLNQSGQRCGSTFIVDEQPTFASWDTGYLQHQMPDTRHFVIATGDDVIEVLSGEEPAWEAVDGADPGDPLPGKSTHLYFGEDHAAIDRLEADLRERNKPPAG
ncbi:MAG: hypothetical protein ABI051_04165 [Vicinamibacterales bacterium]